MSTATLSSDHDTAAPSRALHIGLWVVQALLGAMFVLAGSLKSFQDLDVLGKTMPWVPALPGALVRFIGLSEIAGGLGLILPSLSRIQPKLTALAAIGLTTVMGLASILHFSRGEFGAIGLNIVLGTLTTFVAWGRLRAAPIAPRVLS